MVVEGVVSIMEVLFEMLGIRTVLRDCEIVPRLTGKVFSEVRQELFDTSPFSHNCKKASLSFG